MLSKLHILSEYQATTSSNQHVPHLLAGQIQGGAPILEDKSHVTKELGYI